MKRRVVAFCAVLLAASTATAQAQVRYAVAPGSSVGAIKLGMSIGAASRILGAPSPADELREPGVLVPGGTRGYSWDDQHIVVETNEAGTIYYIGIAMPGAATSDGLGYGSDLDDIQDRLGVPSRTVPVGHSIRMIYDALGIQFSVSMLVGTDFYHKVESVGVFVAHQ